MSVKEWLDYLKSNSNYKLCLIANCISIAMLLLAELDHKQKNKLIEKLADIQVGIGHMFEESFEEEHLVN